MTRISGHRVNAEEAQGTISLQTSGVERIGISQGGVINFASALAIASVAGTTATTGTFAAGAGTAALSGSSWVGNTGTRAYTVSDIVSALKQAGILPV